MTGERLLHTSICTQLTTATSWVELPRSQEPLGKTNVTAYTLLQGRKFYNGLGNIGVPYTMNVELILRVHIKQTRRFKPATATGDAAASDVDNTIVTFFAGTYLPPAVTAGDPMRVDGVSIAWCEALTYSDLNTSVLRVYHLIANCTYL